MKKFIGFSVPTYNEEENISTFLDSIINNFDNSLITICVVDDQSNDNTVNVVKSYIKRYKFIYLLEREKKYKRTQVYTAYHAGLSFLLNKNINIFCQIDSDNMVDIHSIKSAINFLDKNYNLVDMIKLSKYHRDSTVDRKFIRKFYSYLYSFICKIFYGSVIKDYSTGIRFYNLRTVFFLNKNIKLFSSPIGLLDDLLSLINNNFIIKEMPFILSDRKFGSSFLTIRESFLCLYELILCIFINLKKKKKLI
jgi:glycosyltransferase involved in cell wall biosynthesis